MQWYVDEVLGAGHDKEMFYTDPQINQYYRDYVSTLVNRTNTITGIQYLHDSTIFAWVSFLLSSGQHA